MKKYNSMIFDRFSRNGLFNISIIPLLCIVFWVRIFWADIPYTALHLPIGITININPILSSIIATLCLIFSTFLLIKLNQQNDLLDGREHFLGITFVLICGAFNFFTTLSSTHIAVIFILTSILMLFSCFKNDHCFGRLFNTFFVLGISSWCCPFTSIVFIPLMITATKLFSFSWRHFVVALSGFVCPWFFLSVYSLSVSNDFFAPALFWLNSFIYNIQIVFSDWSILEYLFSAIIISLFVLGFNYRDVSRKTSALRSFFNIMFILIMIEFIIYIPLSYSLIIVLALPFSVNISSYFSETKRKIVPSILFSVFAILALLIGLGLEL